MQTMLLHFSVSGRSYFEESGIFIGIFPTACHIYGGRLHLRGNRNTLQGAYPSVNVHYRGTLPCVGRGAEQLFQKADFRARTDDYRCVYNHLCGIYLRRYCQYRFRYAGLGLQRPAIQYHGSGVPAFSVHLVSFLPACNPYRGLYPPWNVR